MKKILLFISLLMWSVSTLAGPINKIIFFGDSLTDNGNLYNFLGLKIMPKSPPYYQGRFANGLAWSDVTENFFRNKYGIDSVNYAVGGATVQLLNPFEGNLPFVMNEEVNNYLLRTAFSDRSKTLFVIWVGANDYTGGRSDVSSATTGVVNSIMATVTNLIDQHGAKNFLILNLPDLSKIPYAKTVKFADNLRDLSIEHNKKLLHAVNNLQNQRHDKVTIAYVDTFVVFNELINDPEKYNKQYNKNLKNTSESCWKGGYTLQGKNKRAELNELSAEIEKGLAKQNLTSPAKKIDPQQMAEFILNSPDLSQAYTTNKLYTLGVTPCDKPDEYIFWDKVHPTAPVHDIFGKIVIQKILDTKFIN